MKISNSTVKQLIKKYPYLQPRNVWTDEICTVAKGEDAWYNGQHSLPTGWERLFLLYVKNLKPILERLDLVNKYRFSQIKEKYGSMRIYDFGNTPEGHDLNHAYERISEFVCETCGAPAKFRTNGYITQYCRKCFKQHNKKWKESASRIHLKLTSKRIIFSDNHKTIHKLKLNKLWKEYINCSKMSDDEFIQYILC